MEKRLRDVSCPREEVPCRRKHERVSEKSLEKRFHITEM
jgi:hypothetical protein